MINNYDSVETCLLKGSANSKKQESTSFTGKKGLLVSFMTVFLMLFSFLVQGQTTLISPTGDGGFENGATFAANGWQTVNPATDTWQVGNVPVSSNGANCAYISANGGAAWTYSQFSVFNHVYRDVTIPAGENKVTLTFKWKAGGEGSTTFDWDNMKVFWSPTTFTPTSTTAVTGATQLIGPGAVSGMYKLSSANWNTETIVFSATPGTYRLIFQWKSDGLDIANPPAALDEISLTSQAPGNFISIADGNWSNPATWDANAVPTGLDNVTVAAHTVTIDAVGQAANNLTIQGSLEFGATPGTFNVNGNLTLEAGAEFLVFNGTTGKAIVVSGNIVNDGNIDLSIGATTTGSLTLNGSTVQTVSGSGTFANNLIRNLIFTNTSTTIPNINWDFDDISVAYILNIANAKINLNSNKITFGTGSAVAADTGNTFTSTNGGFLNGTFSRWWTAGQTGYTTSGPTAIPTVAGGRYPFYSPTGEQRIFYIGRTTPSAGGKYAVTYNNATTSTTGLNIVDGAYTVTNQWDGNFVVTLDGTTPDAASNWVTMFTPNALITSAPGARITGESVALSGTHVNTSNAPYGQRSGVSTADLTSATGLYLGVNAADVPIVSIASGDWNATSTWSGGVVPTCANVAIIANGHTVTSSTSGNFAKGISIASGGTLEVSAGDLTVGCTLNNNTLTNNGTLTVSGGLLAVNGNISNAAGSTFNHTGGNIDIDGNNGGSATGSVASGTPLLLFLSNNINLAGGTITIIDPHTATTNTNAVAVKFDTSSATANSRNTSPSHILQFGDGVSTDAGGNTSGFFIDSWSTTGYLVIGKLVVNGATGTNRFVSSRYNLSVRGDIDVEANSTLNLTTPLVLGGNLLVKVTGNYTNTSGTALNYVTDNTGSNLTFSPVTLPQTITNNGVMANAVASPTANLFSLEVNNTNAVGVTLNSPISISGTLTMTSGIINTTTTNLLTLGTATAAGILAGTPSATNMVRGPFARTIANANANTNYLLFPVGKTTYAPIWAAPATTAASVMKAETFDTNTGTQSAAIANMATNRRWELPLVSGTITNINVRLGDAGVLATSIPVQAPSASGEYTSTFGSVATAVAGVSTQSTTPVLTANYTGFLSYADSNACVGVPTPGNTIASSNVICLGTSVTLSLQNLTTGSGVSYQWFSSPDGVTYSPVASATNPTYTTTPTASTYFMCEVTCATGPSTAASIPVQVTFANEVTATVPATRCGTGTVDLSATPSAGATINWFANATGGSPLASGNLFTTPSINTSATYYAAATTSSVGSLVLGAGATNSSSTAASFLPGSWGGAKTQYIIRASELIQAGLTAGPITSLGFEPTNSGQTYQGFFVQIGHTTESVAPSTTFIANAGLNFVYAGTEANDGFTPVAGSVNNLTFGTGAGTTSSFVWDGTSNIVVSISWSRVPAASTSTSTTMKVDNVGFVSTAYRQRDNISPTDMLNETGVATFSGTSSNRPRFTINGQLICSSTRVPVVATVSSPPALTLSGATATICSGDSSTAVTLTAGTSDYNTFVWSPATGVTGDETIGWTFNPTITTVYTLTATQTSGALCSTTATFTVNVNPLPTSVTITPTAPSICVDAIQSLAVTGGTLGVVGKVGSGVATNTGSTPFKGWFGGSKTQALYTPAELTALGMEAGQSINSIGYVALSGTPIVLNNFTINAGFVSNTTIGTAFISGATNVVLAPTNYTPAATGNIDFTLSTPLTWDGVSSLLIETCFNNNNGGGVSANSISVQSTVVAAGLNIYLSQDNNATVCTNVDVPSTTTTRPNLRISTLETANITWSPVTNLFTDAAATIPYVAGSNATTVYVQSATPSTTVYTATATIGATGCFRSNTVSVTVSALPDVTISRVDDTLTAAETGATYQWYTCTAGPVYTIIPGATSQSYVATAIGSYAVDVTLNGCTSRSTCFDVTALGSSSFDMNALTVYPNPVVDILSIRYNEEITAINVYDLSGRLVKQITPNQTEVEVNMSELAAAMYIVKVNAGESQTEIKVIKK